MDQPIVVEAENLSVEIGGVSIVKQVSFSLGAGETLAIVGESGCGKSMTALALMRLLPAEAAIVGGAVHLAGQDLATLPEARMQRLRGAEISMIFQEPVSALDPLMTVGAQIAEALTAHRDLSRAAAKAEALGLLELVGIPEAAERLKQFPFELSGGMCQRVMIAAALACRPAVLIADEPTTALDVTIQAQILDLIRKLREDTGTAVLLITHDMGVVADMADQVAVMYAGGIVEQGDVYEIFAAPRHPYTRLLLRSIPRLDGEPKSILHVIEGTVPDARNWPAGCRFHPRCPHAGERCREQAPPLEDHAGSHAVACWKLDEIGDNGS